MQIGGDQKVESVNQSCEKSGKFFQEDEFVMHSVEERNEGKAFYFLGSNQNLHSVGLGCSWELLVCSWYSRSGLIQIGFYFAGIPFKCCWVWILRIFLIVGNKMFWILVWIVRGFEQSQFELHGDDCVISLILVAKCRIRRARFFRTHETNELTRWRKEKIPYCCFSARVLYTFTSIQ